MANKLRPEEETSGKAVECWLRTNGIGSSWTGVDDDPPDLEFLLSKTGSKEELWGIEVTGLFQNVIANGKEVNARGVINALEAMCVRLTAAIPPGAGLHYSLFVSAPLLIDWRTLEKRAQAFIAGGTLGEEPLDFEEISNIRLGELAEPDVVVLKQSMISVSGAVICALPGNGGVTPIGMLDGTARLPKQPAAIQTEEERVVADIMASSEASVDDVLRKKLPRMQKVCEKRRYDRKLILMWPDYAFSDADRLREVLSKRALPPEYVDAILFSRSASSIEVVADVSGMFA